MAQFEGFVGAAYQAPSIYQDAQECINWYPEIDPTKQQGERGVVALYPTPGLILQSASFPSAPARGYYVLPGGDQMIAVVGSGVYLVSASFVATLVGRLETNSGPVSISDDRVVVYIVDGPKRYTYTVIGGAFAVLPITDGGFNGADKVDYIDGFLIYNDPNSNQWGCTTNDSGVSPALSFGSMLSSSDNIVTLIADHREAVLIGEKTTERWVNVGSFPFPFQVIPGTSIQHGCAAKFSVARVGESIAWLSQDSRGQTIVIQMAGYQPQRISTHAVEVDIGSGVINDAIGFTYQQEGHEFYILTFPTQDKTWVYDVATELWHKRAWRDNENVLHRIRGNCACVFQGLNLVGDWQTGQMYALSLTTYTDNGQPILRMRRTPHVTQSLNRVFHEFLQVQFQPGVGLQTGQGSDPKMMLRWSDDGASTWSAYYPVAIGKVGAYKNRAIKRQIGESRDRVYEVTMTDPVKSVIVSAELFTSEAEN